VTLTDLTCFLLIPARVTLWPGFLCPRGLTQWCDRVKRRSENIHYGSDIMPVEWKRIPDVLPEDFRALDRAPAQLGFRGSGGGANGACAAALATSWAVSFFPRLTGSIRAS
jgi:hypothetical protein